MFKLLPTAIALCFLFEPIYFLTRGIIEPTTPRMEEQHISFSILFVLSAILPAVAYLFSGKIHIATYRCFCVILAVFTCFLVWSIYYSSIITSIISAGIVNDLILSSVFIVKGIAIGSFCLRKRFVPDLLKNLSSISIVLSLLMVFVLAQQLKAGMFYPGLGGSTYQKTSYIIAQLIVLNFLASPIFGLNRNTILRFFVFVINVILFVGIIYNGGRGAALAIILVFSVLFYYQVTEFIRSIKVLSVKKLHFLVVGFSGLCIGATGIAIDPEVIMGVLRGAGRIFEIVTLLGSNQGFEGSALSHRDVIYATTLEAISLSPGVGYGPLWSSRLVVPAHNIFLYFFLQYGVLLGSILVFSVIFLFLRGFQDKKLRIFYFVLAPTFTYLMFSGNYLLNFEFWMFLVIALSTIRFRPFHAT